MAAGVVPESSIDTLLMYAYAQIAVDKVTLEIDRDEETKGEHPAVTYKLKLKPKALATWKAYKKAESIKNSILRKATLLALAKIGAPLGVDEEIKRLASEYLPAKYTIKVEINE